MLVPLLPLLLFAAVSQATKNLLQASVREESPRGTFVLSLPKAMDIDKEMSPAESRRIRYLFLDREAPYFQLDSRSGILQTRVRIDRESVCSRRDQRPSDECFLTVLVKLAPIRLFRVAQIRVHIEDMNDNTPSFSQPRLVFRVKENSGPNLRLRIPVSDPDSQRYSLDSVSLEGRDRQHFTASLQRSRAGVELTLKPRLDREVQEKYVVKVVAKDGGSPARSGSTEVTVEIRDENDCTPEWLVANFSVSVPEDRPVNAEVFRLMARDSDAGDNGRVVYGLASRDAERLFYVDPDSGSVRIRAALDYETLTRMEVPVIARDDGKEKQNTASATLVVRLEDVNDNSPLIHVTPLQAGDRLSIPENLNEGRPVATVQVSDADSGKSKRVACSMDGAGAFRLDPMSQDVPDMYTLVSNRELDREVKAIYEVTVVCHDLGSPQRTSSRALTIHVADENDNKPRFRDHVVQLSFPEGNHIGQLMGTVNASDRDEGGNGAVEYSLSAEGRQVANIDATTGRLYARIKFDRERKDRYHFRVFARDSPSDSPRHTATATAEVTITDVNDHAPRFPRVYVFVIPEHARVNTLVGTVAAEDADSGPNGRVTYRLLSGIREFSVHAQRGDITVRSSNLDRERKAMYEVRVRAEDGGNPVRFGDTLVRINLRDINDHSPRFIFPNPSNNVVNVSCKEHPNEIIARVHANDSDSGRNAFVIYDLVRNSGHSQERPNTAVGTATDGRYELDKTSGQLLLVRPYETCRSRRETLLIKASDMGEQPKTSLVTLTILVTDLQPRFDEGLPDMGHMRADMTAIIGLIIATVLLIAILVGAIWILRRYSVTDGRDKYTEGQLEATVATNQHPTEHKPESPDGASLRMPGTKHDGFDTLTGEFCYGAPEPHLPPLYDYACGDDDEDRNGAAGQATLGKAKIYEDAPYQAIRGLDCGEDGMKTCSKTLPYSKLNTESMRPPCEVVKCSKSAPRSTTVCLTEFKPSPSSSSHGNTVTTLKNPYCTVSFV